MRIQTSHLWLRIGATALGLGYGIVGVFAIHMNGAAPSADLGDRTLWLGITFLIASALAISVSWLVEDLSNIWCIPAKKSKQTRLPSDDG